MYNLLQLNGMKVAELKEVADKLAIENADKLKKQDLIYKILDVQALKAEASADTPAQEPSAPASEQPSKGKRERARKPAKGAEAAGDLFQEAAPEESVQATEATNAAAEPAASNESAQPQQGQPRQLQGPNQGDRRQQGQRDQRDQRRDRKSVV